MNRLGLILNIKKQGPTIIVWIIGIIFTSWLTNLLDPLMTTFNANLKNLSINSILWVIGTTSFILNMKIPLYSIIIFIAIILTLYKLLYKLNLSRQQFKIIKADYGSGTTYVDITNRLNDLIVDNKLKITLSNGVPGLDPTPGVVKIGNITYMYNNKITSKKYTEGQPIELPV